MAEFAVYLLAAYLGSAALLVYVLLCGDSDFHRNGLIGALILLRVVAQKK
jgi:hypothetical protein